MLERMPHRRPRPTRAALLTRTGSADSSSRPLVLHQQPFLGDKRGGGDGGVGVDVWSV